MIALHTAHTVTSGTHNIYRATEWQKNGNTLVPTLSHPCISSINIESTSDGCLIFERFQYKYCLCTRHTTPFAPILVHNPWISIVASKKWWEEKKIYQVGLRLRSIHKFNWSWEKRKEWRLLRAADVYTPSFNRHNSFKSKRQLINCIQIIFKILK